MHCQWKLSSLYACAAVGTATLKTEEMMVSLHGLCFVLLILAGLVPSSKGADTGCDDWSISGRDVCCKKCKPGNRLVRSCGRDPALLCTPCEANTFKTNPNSLSCLKCTQCIGIQFVLKPCNITSDTVCGCKNGYRCGNDKCEYCVTECREGEEPTELRSCRKCPEGTFNDKVHSMCEKWKESCPEGQIMKAKGNAFRDHECMSVNEIIQTKNNLHVEQGQKNTEPNEPEILDNSLSVVTGENKEKINWLPVVIAGGVGLLAVLCIIASVAACVKAQSKTEKPKADISDQELSQESTRIMVVEQEACSFHHPEQEQGSSESISTQDSETKLIV